MTDTIETFNYNTDVLTALLWQYNEATNLEALLRFKNKWLELYNQNFWTAWYPDIFDLRTANLFGLNVWSIILDLPLYVPLSPPVVSDYWGFNEIPPINTYVNFTNGNFAPGELPPLLTEEEQRIALKLRYYQCVTRGAVPEVNKFLDFVFGPLGGCWMVDNLDMTITYTFGFHVSTALLKVIQANFLLPKPAGVAISYVNPP
jgi:hypothetical protein